MLRNKVSVRKLVTIAPEQMNSTLPPLPKSMAMADSNISAVVAAADSTSTAVDGPKSNFKMEYFSKNFMILQLMI